MGLVGWLPDSERLLVTRRVPTDTVREYIETINVRTGEVQRYAERHSISAKPVWLPTPQAVAYGDIDLVEKQVKLRISTGQSGQGRQIDGLWSPNVAAEPDGRRVIFFPKSADKRPNLFIVTQAITQSLPFNLASLEQPGEEGVVRGSATAYDIAWHPSQPKVAFYNNYHLFLVNLDTGQAQEIDLGRRPTGEILWTFYARWSPDGRYLALLTTAGIPPVHFVDLAILDTTTGTLRRVDFGLRLPYVSEVAWAPNSRHMAIRAVVSQQEGRNREGLYLVDAVTGATRRMLPDVLFGTNGDFTWNMDWSPNGDTIATACPIIGEVRVCLFPVTIRR
jgi:Tol biopolymer transport system component